ncbi:hypothetical protein JCM24511_07522 [Saitozyma sp. JCM 24511]|nr:hypothetical protein JCM24511_07522 [Saitozyma sp. JCM 24511]
MKRSNLACEKSTSWVSIHRTGEANLNVLEHALHTGRARLVKDLLDVCLGDLERLGDEVRHVLADETLRVELERVDLLDEVVSERENTGPEVSRVEGNVDTGERDRGETTLEDDLTVLLLLLNSHVPTAVDDLGKLLLELLDAHHGGKLLEIELLHLEHVEDVGERGERAEFTGTDVLLVGDVEVDNLEEDRLLLGDRVDNLAQSHLAESLAHTGRVGGHHGVLRLARSVALDGTLHGDTSEEDDVGEGRDREDIGDGGKGRVLSERVTGKRGVLVDETLGLHVVERGLFGDDKGDLGVLRGEEETLRRLGLDLTTLVDGVIREVHVSLADGLTLDTTKVDDGAGHGRGSVELHAHADFLGSLAGEDVGGRGLQDLSGTVDDLLAALVERLDLDDLLAVAHGNVGELDLNLVTGQDHADEADLVRHDALGVVVGDCGLDVLSGRGGGPHAMGDGAGKRGKVGEVRVDVDGVEVARDLRVRLVGGRSLEHRAGRVGDERVTARLERDGVANRLAVTLEVLDNRVAVRVVRLVVDDGDLDELLGTAADERSARHLDRGERRLVLVSELGLGLECERGSHLERNRVVVPLKPSLGLEDTDRRGAVELDNIVGLVDGLKRVLKVLEASSVEERRGDLDDGLALAEDVPLDLDSLAAVTVDDGDDAGFGGASVTSEERGDTVHHAEAVGQVHEVEQITVDVRGEDGLHDGLRDISKHSTHLPSQDNGKVHGRHDLVASSSLEALTLVADDVAESLNGLSVDRGGLARESGVEGKFWELLVVTEPETPVEVLDLLVATVDDLVDRGVAHLGLVLEGEVQGHRDAATLLVHDERDDLGRGVEGELNGLEVLGGDRLDLLARRLDLDGLASTGAEDATERVAEVSVAVDNVDAGQSGAQPADVVAGDKLEPVVNGGDSLADLESTDVAGDSLLDEARLDSDRLGADVVDSRDLRLVAVVVALEDLARKQAFDVTKEVLDGLIGNSRVLDGDGTLEDTYTLRVLVKDGIDVLGGPERVLLEPDLERVVKDRDEWHGLLAGALADGEEERLVLGSDELGLGAGVRLEERVDGGEGVVESRERLDEGLLCAVPVDPREALFDAAKPVANEVAEGDVHPTVLLGDVHESDHTARDLLVGHGAEVRDDGAVGLLAEPRLVKVLVEAVDDVVLLGLEPRATLLAGLSKDSVVELAPELDTASGNLVDRLAELGADSEDTTGGLVVSALPLGIVDTGRVDNELLDRRAGVGLLGDHDARGVEGTIERHGLKTVHLDGPVTGDVRPGVLGATETGTGNERDVAVVSDRRVGGDDGLVEVLARVVTTSTTTCPLKDDGVVRVGSGDVDDLADTLDGSGLEGDVLDPGSLERGDDLGCLLRAGDTSGHAETLDGETLAAHLLPQRELEGELSLVDVERVESKADTGLNAALDLGHLCTESLGVVVTTTGQLNVEAGVKRGGDEVGTDSGRRHTGDHDRRLAQHTGERRVDVDLAVAETLAELGLDMDALTES